MRVTDKDIEDVIDIGLYGAIDYWVSFVLTETKKGSDFEDIWIVTDDGEKHHLDREKLRETIKSHCDFTFWELDGSFNAGMVDADIADILIQKTIFTEQVYG